LLRLGIVDGVLPEPDGGTQSDHLRASAVLRGALMHALHDLLPLDPQRLRGQRQARFRKFGRQPRAGDES
jgi:acetyl-CoA carboxylase carboxyl transferase subunit beta